MRTEGAGPIMRNFPVREHFWQYHNGRLDGSARAKWQVTNFLPISFPAPRWVTDNLPRQTGAESARKHRIGADGAG